MTGALPRSSWTDSQAASPALLVPSSVRGLAVHWDGPPVPAKVYAGDRAAVAAFLRGVRRFHTSKGWSDIAYQWAVDTAGRRWELRGWRRQSAANGDQAVNRTHGAVVALIGQGQAATPAMLDGLRDAVSDFRAHYPHARRIVGHQDVRPEPTSCPGPQLERLIRGGGLEPMPRPPAPTPAPPTPAPPTREDDHVMVIIVTPAGAWYHLAGGKLIHLSAHAAASTKDAPGRVVVDCDDATWKRYAAALPVVR